MASPLELVDTSNLDDPDNAGAPKASDAGVSADSPLASVTVSRSSKSSGMGDTPLSQRLFQQADELHPDRAAVLQKRDAIMQSYQKLMDAQAYQKPSDIGINPEMVAWSSPILAADPRTAALGQGFANSAKASLNQQTAAQLAAQQQAATGLAGATTNEGFDSKDLEDEIKLLQAGALNDYRSNQLNTKIQIAEQGKKQVVKDQNGNPIGAFDKITGKMVPLQGDDAATAGSGQPGIIKVPGIATNSPVHAGINSVLTDQGMDPAGMLNRTRADLAQSTKDSAADRAAYDASVNAAKIASDAKQAIDAGYSGGNLGAIESKMNANLGTNFSDVKNRDLLSKYSNQVTTQMAGQMHGTRIGVGMEQFLKNSTFNPDISKDANLKIVQNLQDLPALAKTNMELGNLTAQLPSAYKNAIYSEFTADNPPFVPEPNGKADPKTGEMPQIVNPVYKSKTAVQDWLTARATKNQSADANPAAPAVATPPVGPADIAKLVAIAKQGK